MKVTYKFLSIFMVLWLAPTLSYAIDETKIDAKNLETYLRQHTVLGPKDIPMANEAILHLPKDLKFVPRTEALNLIKQIKGSADENLQGLIYSDSGNEFVMMTVAYVSDGYIRDNTADTLNADNLLQSIRTSNEKENESRKKVGAKQLTISGWIEKPTYDRPKHQLVYSLKTELENEPSGKPSGVNYNVFSLGRDGYFAVDLLSDVNIINQKKHFANEMTSAIEYNKGKSYEDFNESTDKIAEYGLAALVGGVVAKKIGLLALAGVFILKSIKAIGVAVVVAISAFKRMLAGKKLNSV